MINLIVGVVVIVLGIIGIRANWWFFLDLFKALIYLGFIGFGVIAMLAGMRSFKGKEQTD